MSDIQEPNDLTSDAGGDRAAPAGTGAPQNRRRWQRRLLLALGPGLVLLGGALFYLNSGRYIETENAYVKSDSVLISAEVSGPIKNVHVRENQHVDAGDVLFELDDAQYRLILARGEAQLAAVESFIESLEASYQQQLEQLERAKIDRDFYARELERQQELVATNLGSEADVDSAQHDFDVAAQQIPIIEQSLAQLRAQIGGKIALQASDTAASRGLFFDGNAAYRTVEAMIDEAELNLERTIVRAPFDGVVSRVPTVGRHVTAGGPS